jgi:hypothetical protein
MCTLGITICTTWTTEWAIQETCNGADTTCGEKKEKERRGRKKKKKKKV